MTFSNSIRRLGRYVVCPVVALICWATLSLSVSYAQDKPAWRLNQGDQFRVETTKLSERTSTLDSRIAAILSDVTIEFDWTVKSVDDSGTATITQELKKFSIDIGDPAVPAQAIKYASDDDPADLSSTMRKLQRKSKPLVGLKCTLTMASNGEIKSVLLDAGSEKNLAKLTNAPNLKALFSKELLENFSDDFSLNSIPADAPPAGWSKTQMQRGGFGEVSINHKFSISPVETIKGRKSIEITVASSLTPSETEDTPEKPKAKNKISQSLVSFAGSGSIIFDQADGYFSSSQFKTSIKSKRQYREKVIVTSSENETRIKIEKK